MAQLIERSLPTPEVHGSNPVIGKPNNIYILYAVNCIEKTKIKKQVAGNSPFLKKWKTYLLDLTKLNRISEARSSWFRTYELALFATYAGSTYHTQ